jgi:hypothetical protein
MKCYTQLRKEILDHLEESMTQDSLVGSTVSTRSRKGGSVVSRMSSPSVKSVDTSTSRASEANKPKESSKTSGYYSPSNFYTKHLTHAFIPKPDFEGYRQDVKKQYEGGSNFLSEDLHQMPDNASAFVTRIRQRAANNSPVYDERRQVLNPRITWYGSIDRF